ncbi:MAG: hypothetical protein JWO24_3469 [Rhodospirillales bacterium]|jgi:uncharacterized small protein (DUF1192 family)|nr:hypothetical protein [Rhodospirillales bacterium]
MENDDKPRPANGFVPPAFDGWSVADLRDHIAALRADVTRAEAVIAAREGSQKAAAGFFNLPKAPPEE